MPWDDDGNWRESTKLGRIGIIQLQAEGYSYRAIADRIMMWVSTVSKIVRRWRVTRTVKNRTCSGRPQKIGPQELRRLNRVAENNPHASLAENVNKFRLNCYPQTIQKALHRLDFQLRIYRRIPFLNARSKWKWLIWCWHRWYWTVEDRRRKFYSDEIKVEIGVGGGYDSERVWWKLRIEHQDCYLWATFKGERVSTMFQIAIYKSWVAEPAYSHSPEAPSRVSVPKWPGWDRFRAIQWGAVEARVSSFVGGGGRGCWKGFSLVKNGSKIHISAFSHHFKLANSIVCSD